MSRYSNRRQRQERRRQECALTVEEIHPKTDNQKEYFKTIRSNTYTFCVGPPGTGKTFIALWHGLKAVLDQKNPIEKIIVVRPMVEVKNFDEKSLGSLPGDAQQKVAPWVGAIMDSLKEVMHEQQIGRLISSKTIEFLSMSLCRGRSFNNAFVIIDEAQNITLEGDGMKMLLTRLGRNSKMVVAGDLKQSDLSKNKASALCDAMRRFENERGFGLCALQSEDIVRNKHISRILELYGDYNREQGVKLEEILKS